ncbi:hypothetical protein TRFO_22481 [Tritrichomonas foetus]|uniref:RING-type domain-containing protein n=1 Tax=Tritrichomonas foetus TaxID=1144522 RepID=A0A1J4KBV4_9EUKA|nr:hypothetical protein TRFO_22481 [Tritrichomonas foetus]|eukprot:OHT08889.1 hypothetical protein TRFO_22481 [Tritrichomonas foetus]
MRKVGAGKTKVVKIKGTIKSTTKKEKDIRKRLCCTIQSNNYNIDKIESNDVCVICGLGIKRPLPNLKGQLDYHSCYAPLCLQCLQRCLEQQFKMGIKELFCPICFHAFSDTDRAIVHPQINNQISEELTLSNLENVVNCRFCPNRYIFEPVSKEQVNSEYHGRKLTDIQILCAALNAVTCNECRISSCRNCGAVPYHLGETCEEHKWWIEGSVCRICGRAANPQDNDEVALLNCGHPDCIEIANQMCDHIHACGHACCGVKNEKFHPHCPECTDGESLCPHCDKELWGSLCISLQCKHTIHLSCAKEIIMRSRSGPELKLPLCPVIGCGEFIKHEILEREVNSDYVEWLHLEQQIDRIAHQRIIAEGIEFHPEVASKSSPFSRAGEKAALNWAKKKLRFMICTQHTVPVIYTSGRIDDPPLNSFSCPNCIHYPYPNCPKHGFNYMQFKCDCCCSVGVRRGKSHSGDGYVWLCEICFDMPGRSDLARNAACKGNCRFAPHPRSRNEFYGRCQKCGIIKSTLRSRGLATNAFANKPLGVLQASQADKDKNKAVKK